MISSEWRFIDRNNQIISYYQQADLVTLTRKVFEGLLLGDYKQRYDLARFYFGERLHENKRYLCPYCNHESTIETRETKRCSNCGEHWDGI